MRMVHVVGASFQVTLAFQVAFASFMVNQTDLHAEHTDWSSFKAVMPTL